MKTVEAQEKHSDKRMIQNDFDDSNFMAASFIVISFVGTKGCKSSSAVRLSLSATTLPSSFNDEQK